jgi:hypothetical protein
MPSGPTARKAGRTARKVGQRLARPRTGSTAKVEAKVSGRSAGVPIRQRRGTQGREPTHDVRCEVRGHPVADSGSSEVVGEGRSEDPRDDGPLRATELGSEDEGKELRVVAHFGDRDHGKRREECDITLVACAL